MTSNPAFRKRPWSVLALVCHLWEQARLSWGWMRRGFPLRPADWESEGIRGANPLQSEAYANWYHSSLRSTMQMLAEFPGVTLMMVVLFIMLTGSFGTAGFGIPALFFPDKPTIFPQWEWSWALEQLFTGMISGWLLFQLCFACYLLNSREWLKWRGPLSQAEADDPGQPHRVNQYLSATWSVVFALLVITLLLGATSGADWLGWVRTCLFLVGAYLGSALSWRLLLYLIGWQRRQGGLFGWLRRWCTGLTLSYRRLREARPLHPDVESPHAIGTLLVAGLLLCWLVGFVWPDAFARLPTAAFLCLLLGVFAAVIAFFHFHGFTSTLAKPLLLIAAIWVIKVYIAWPVEHRYESL